MRIWEMVDRSNPDECWIWPGAKTRKGYGRMSVNNKIVSVHRFAYEQKHGPLPVHIGACHTCDNPPCCNPAHLWAGTVQQNNRDRVLKGRGAWGDKNGMRKFPGLFAGEKHPLTKVTDIQRMEMATMKNSGMSYSAIGRRFKISRTTATKIITKGRGPSSASPKTK